MFHTFTTSSVSISNSMDELPPSLLVDILTRLDDSAHLARCRLVSAAFCAAAHEVRSLKFFCTQSRYLKLRSPETRGRVTPFKAVLSDLLRNSRVPLESVSIGVEKSLAGVSYDDVEDESDDLHLTDVRFVEEWLPRVCGELRSLSISDFWIQSCWRRSDILRLISSCCHALLKLEVKNAWLCVDGLICMPRLTSLTLEFVRLDDEDLNKVNDCFPLLQVLNLIGVGGLKEPKVCLSHLNSCQWTVSNAPFSLTILAPSLVKLELRCIRPRSLIIDAPLLAECHISIEEVNELQMKQLLRLKHLQLESRNLCKLLHSFGSSNATTIKEVTVNSFRSSAYDETTTLSLESVVGIFPNATCLTLQSGAWSEMLTYFLSNGLNKQSLLRGLKEITVQLVRHNIDTSLWFLSCIMECCTSLSDIGLLMDCEIDHEAAYKLVSKWSSNNRPSVKLKWGTWKEGTEDIWVSDFF
ncbi:F-box/LRR-repeat protein At4g29420 [Linum perenne]